MTLVMVCKHLLLIVIIRNNHLEHVWKVARYTSAAPVFFKELDNYIDGGVLANNPCSLGLSAIQTLHWYVYSYSKKLIFMINNCVRQLGQKLDISLIVSVGSGRFSIEELERTDFQEVFHFGKHWFRAATDLKAKIKRFATLLANAVRNFSGIADLPVSIIERLSYYYCFRKIKTIVQILKVSSPQRVLEIPL